MKTLKQKFQFLALILLTAFISCSNNANSNKDESSGNQIVEKTNIDIQAAVLSNNVDLVNAYIKSGSDLNAKEPMGGSTPLITAAVFGKTDVAKLIVCRGRCGLSMKMRFIMSSPSI